MSPPGEGVPRKETTFAVFEDKIRDAQRDDFSVEDQVKTIDWWIKQLGKLKDKVESGVRI